ncbi:uncharacterized protein LOC135122441 [Zophobas morio]|uniref:uncharacterized protein LOC135122441 n=1 Tax=Zophobas morio TaxID=2755281 RepID=UPI003082CFA5
MGSTKTFSLTYDYQEILKWVDILCHELIERLEEDYEENKRYAKTLSVHYTRVRNKIIERKSKSSAMPSCNCNGRSSVLLLAVQKLLSEEEILPCVSVSVVAENFRDEKSSNVSLEKFFNEEKLEFSNNLLTHLPKKDLSSSLKTIKFFFPQNNNNIVWQAFTQPDLEKMGTDSLSEKTPVPVQLRRMT